MSICIKNLKVVQLARQAAEVDGIKITDVIKLALEEHLQRKKGQRLKKESLEDIMDISRRCNALPDLDKRSPEKILGYDKKTGGLN